MGRNAKILIPLTQPYPAGRFGIGTDFVMWFNPTRTVLTLYFGGDKTTWSASSFDEKTQLQSLFLPQIVKLFPDIPLDEDVHHWQFHKWEDMPHTEGSYSYVRAGYDREFANILSYHNVPFRAVFAPFDDAVFLCGEHTSLTYLGTMEGAVESGKRVAQGLLSLFASSSKAK